MEITSKSDWDNIDWAKVQSVTSKLQKRIYRATRNGDMTLVMKLQKLLIKSKSAKLLATRKVTQDNQGKKTAAIDGIKSINKAERMELAMSLNFDGKAEPVKRVWIPKDNGKTRGLGISTMKDRAKQALMKLALEPEWEAKFEPNSYGFRPSRSAHDAVEAIKKHITFKPKYVLDADISKCFDKINHNKLIQKTTHIKEFQNQVSAWLKAGIMEDNEFFITTEGTPQGGVISPLLANIALDGMERLIEKEFPSTKTRYISKSKERFGYNVSCPRLIRYADDFVIICEEKSVIERSKVIIEEYLNEWGLSLNKDKTQIVHTLNEHQGNQPGIDFLGFNIKQYPRGKKHTGKVSNGSASKKLTYKTYIIPSKKSVAQHYKKLAEKVRQFNGKTQNELIGALQRIITGWCNYYKYCNSKRTFSKLNHILWRRLLRWAVRRHRMKGTDWVVKKYWATIHGRKWTFTDGNRTLRTHDQHKAGAKYIKIKEDKSPYDGDEQYWQKRLENKHKIQDTLKAKLIYKQKGKCPLCDMKFSEEEQLDIHHIQPKSEEGTNEMKNLIVVHKHCHIRTHQSKVVAQGKV